MTQNTVRAALRPRLWIVAGPNGSGKSSAYDRSDVDEFGGSAWIFDNSPSEPELVGRKRKDKIHLRAKIPGDLMKSLLNPED